ICVRKCQGTRLTGRRKIMWSCPKCRAKVDSSFEVCWSCGTSSDGEEDPSFVRADDVAHFDDPPQKSDQRALDELALELAAPATEVVECYWAKDRFEAKFLVDQLAQDGIQAAADSYDLRIVFAGFFGLVPAGPYFA